MADKREKFQTSVIHGFISLDNIILDTNIRSEYKEAEIEKLAKSMDKYGQLQPIKVYKNKDGKYVVIFGHRRCIAAKKAGLENIFADIVSEPDAINKIYIQAIENEQSESLEPKDRETYIHALKENGETFQKISTTIGISESWARECAIAHLVRGKYCALFDSAGINYGTKDLIALRNASEEQVKEAVALAVENPENKRKIFEDLGKRTKKKKNVGGQRKKSAISVSGDLKIGFSINLDEDKKTFAIQTQKDVNVDERLAGLLSNVLVSYYTDMGYASLSDEK